MNKGDVVLIRGGAGPASKPRPCVIVQRSSTLADAPKVTVCPLTSTIKMASSIRPLLQPTDANGLDAISQVQIDWMFTYRIERIVRLIGSLERDDMREIDTALRRWLDL